jgi:membrane-bound serine protease (ClpP class)
MIQDMTASTIPVCVYVAPSGAHAASAGTYLTYASHIAAMAPGTNIGAASPISMMQPPGAKDINGSAFSTAEQKAKNDAKAYIKSLAQLRDRNITWALQAVEEAESLSAEDALKLGVIDLMADNTRQLLEKIDGMTVKANGPAVTLDTASAEVIIFEADWKTELLGIITDPNIAYILLLVAIYGIFFELMNPGAIVPGVIGVISGVLALYALNLLPFNYAGLLLIILGIAFMIAEVFIAGFGILGIGGVIAFAAGSLLLFDTQTLGSGVSIPLVIAFSLVSIGFFVLIFGYLWRSRSRKVLGGSEEMIGAEAEVLDSYDEGYHIRCHGEIWRAVSDEPLQTGDTVHVTSIDNLILKVTKE